MYTVHLQLNGSYFFVVYIHRTYLLGQNIPLTTEELAAREVKRQKAMDLQEAIKQQVDRLRVLVSSDHNIKLIYSHYS